MAVHNSSGLDARTRKREHASHLWTHRSFLFFHFLRSIPRSSGHLLCRFLSSSGCSNMITAGSLFLSGGCYLHSLLVDYISLSLKICIIIPPLDAVFWDVILLTVDPSFDPLSSAYWFFLVATSRSAFKRQEKRRKGAQGLYAGSFGRSKKHKNLNHAAERKKEKKKIGCW